jgi:hypothetical protein
MGLNGVDNGKFGLIMYAFPTKNLLNRYGDINEKGDYFSLNRKSTNAFTMLGAFSWRTGFYVAMASIRQSTYFDKYAIRRQFKH